MNSILEKQTITVIVIVVAAFGSLGATATWAIQQDKINKLQLERNELLNKLEATLTLQQSIAIDTKAQEVIPSMSAEVSFGFSTQFKGELMNPDKLGVLMFDAEGREIGKIWDVTSVYTGVYVITLDARYLPPGVYVLVISAEHPPLAIYPMSTVKGSAVVTILRE